MKFAPLSAEEAASSNNFAPWPDGTYDYEVKEAEETTSRAGNDMIKLQLWVFNATGGRRIVWDYLLTSQMWKLRNFAASCGLMDAYNAGSINAFECDGRAGELVLATQEAKDGYDAKNVVKSYVAEAKHVLRRAPTPAVKSPDVLDDEIPF